MRAVADNRSPVCLPVCPAKKSHVADKRYQVSGWNIFKHIVIDVENRLLGLLTSVEFLKTGAGQEGVFILGGRYKDIPHMY